MAEDSGDERTCATCAFVHRVREGMSIEAKLQCIEGPPSPLAVALPQGVQISSMFPPVDPRWNCSRWQRNAGAIAAPKPAESH